MEDLRVSVAPKARFAFKRKVVPVPAPMPTPAPASAPALGLALLTQAATNEDGSADPSVSGDKGGSESMGMTLSGRSKQYLMLADISGGREGEGGGRDLTVRDLDGCIVNLSATSSPDVELRVKFSAVHVRDVTNIVLILPVDVSGSVILHGLRRCLVVVGCHQVCFLLYIRFWFTRLGTDAYGLGCSLGCIPRGM